MENANFVLPTLPDSGMIGQHQKELLLIQATVLVVSSVLEFKPALAGNDITGLENLIQRVKVALT